MYAEVDYWCVTVRAKDRGADLDALKLLSEWLLLHKITFGSSGVIPLEWITEDKDPVLEPFVWIPYHNGQEVQMFMNKAGLEPSFVKFECIDSAFEPELALFSESAPDENTSLLGILLAER